jgi:hypothetical protein
MTELIKELAAECTEIITNARHAAQDGEITTEQADAIIQALLADVGRQITFVAEL